MTAETLLAYAKEQYGTEADHPWLRYPDNSVLRHAGGKWYGLVMPVPRSRLGLEGEAVVPVLNVKCDPRLAEGFRKEPGIFPAYHMNKENWLSVLLDGTVEDDTVRFLLDMSYTLTSPGRKK